MLELVAGLGEAGKKGGCVYRSGTCGLGLGFRAQGLGVEGHKDGRWFDVLVKLQCVFWWRYSNQG